MNQILRKNLKRRRKELKLTQEAAAKNLNVKRSRYSSWEQGKAEPGASHLVKIVEVLKVDDLYLFLAKSL